MKILGLVIAVVSLLTTISASAEEDYNALNDQALKLTAQNHVDMAVPLFERALDAAQHVPGIDVETLDAIAFNLAKAYLATDRNSSALTLLETIRDHYARRYGEQHLRLGPVYLDIGRSELNWHPEKATVALRVAIDIYKRNDAKGDPDYIRALINFAYVQTWQNKFEMDAYLYRIALNESIAHFGKDAEVTAEAHYALGRYWYISQNFQSAAHELKRAIAIFEATLSPTDPHTLAARATLVPVYEEMGFSSKAMDQTMQLAMLVPDAEGQDQPLYRVAPEIRVSDSEEPGEIVIEVRFTVTPEGHIDDIEFVGIRTRPEYEAAIKKALSKWIYKPRVVDGKPVASARGMQYHIKVPD